MERPQFSPLARVDLSNNTPPAGDDEIDDRSPGRFIFEQGFFRAHAEVIAATGKPAIEVSDEMLDRGWEAIGSMSWTPEDRQRLALIDTAPDILDQLRFAVKMLGDFPVLNATAQVDAMRQTIAKAEGRA